MSVIEGREGCFLSRVVRENLPHVYPLLSGGWLAGFNVSWLVDVSP